MTTLRSTIAIALFVLGAAAPASSAQPEPVVAPGYDLFVTPDGSTLGVDGVVVDGTLMTFRGSPLGSFGFGDLGTHATGAADTIVRRLDAATPASPRVRIELVGLLLESTNVPGYYVTLQSARPLGLPSTGTLDFSFGDTGGLLTSELLVNYDVRYGAPDGPIVATGSTGLGFVAENVLWVRSVAADDSVPNCVHLGSVGQDWCVEQGADEVCHSAEGIVTHQHCVKTGDDLPPITGVNYRLNGRNTAADFYPVGTASPS